MTSLEKAFSEAAKLSPEDQEQFAAWILAELSSEHRWRRILAETPDLLADLGDEALAEHAEGRTEKLDLDRL